MTKSEIIDRVAKDAGITKNDAAAAVESMVRRITAALQEDERVSLGGLGTWGVTQRRARPGRNPQTGEPIEIKAKRSVRFKPGKQLEAALNR